MKNTKRKAFTLVELLVVIAIIGILFVVLISKVDFATEKSKASGVQTDFRSYQLAIETVARENAGLSTLVDDDASGAEKYAALEAALNKNLDPKLRVEIDENGNIATDAKDPWKEQYLGTYLTPDADGTVKDRGAIVMYSKGSNLKLGSTAEITNGVVNVTIESGKETEGADDYAISTIYTYVNGYGEIKTTTDGFSNNMGDENAKPNPNAPADPSDPEHPENPDNGDDNNYEDTNGWYMMDWSMLLSNDLENRTHEIDAPSIPGGENDVATLDTIAYYADIYTSNTSTDALYTLFYELRDDDVYLHFGTYLARSNTIILYDIGRQVDYIDRNKAGQLPYYWGSLDELEDSTIKECEQCGSSIGKSFEYTDSGFVVENHTQCACLYQNDSCYLWKIPNNLTVVNIEDFNEFYIAIAPLTTIPEHACPTATYLDIYNIKAYRAENGVPVSFYYSEINKTKQDFINDLNIDISGKNEWQEEKFDSVFNFESYLSLMSFTWNGQYRNLHWGFAVTGICLIPTDLVSEDDLIKTTSGLYDSAGTMIASWDELVNVYGMDVEKDYTYSSYNTDESSPYYVLTNISELRKGIRLVFPNSVNKIGNYAFYQMRQLSIDVGVNVATIGDFAFYDSCVYSLTGAQVQDGEMIIPDCVINIGEHAFAFSDEFDTLIIGSNVSYIGNGAFFNCSSLIDLTLGENIIDIGSRAFGNCYNLACDLIIPNTVITIGDEAFDNCSRLTGDIVIPDSVISIGDRAFFNCYGFTGNLAISENVEYIGYDAFAFCSNLSSISVDVANITYHSDSNCLIETQTKILLLGCRNSIIPTDGSVTSLVDNAFACCLSLTNIVIPEEITNIGYGIFSDCRGLESITIESNVLIDYPQDFLYNCNSLTAIYVNPSLLNNYKIAPGWSEYADIFYAYEVTISCPAGGEHFYRNPGIYTADGELVVSWDDLVQTYNLDIETNYNNTLGNANNYLTNKSSLQYILKTHFADAVTNGVIVSIGNVTGIGNYVFFGMDSSLDSLLYSGIDLLEVIIPSSVTSIGQNTFAKSVNIKILYAGTMTQWNSISLGTSWNDGQSNPMIIHCTDGDKEIEITEEESGTGTSGCVSADTLILLADGTTKRIDEITYDDVVMVWNFETGTYDAAPISIIFYHGHKEHDILNLKFSDGTVLKVINDHGLYSVSENNYVYISVNNVEGYIGHQFVKYDGNAYTTVTLVEYCSTVEYTGSYCLQTAGTNNYIAEGMFSLTKPDVEGWFDYFVIGDDMKYDESQMQTDIAKYGLYTYEDFVHTGITYEQFLAFNGPYLKVLVGRGVLTFERIEALIGQYL